MDLPVYSTKLDKVNLIANYLMSESEPRWLFLVGAGGDGKSMATGEAIKIWRRSLGEDDKDDLNDSKISVLPCYPDGNAVYKAMLIKRGSSNVKTIVHVLTWGPEWEFMALEWGAKVVRFERGTEPRDSY